MAKYRSDQAFTPQLFRLNLPQLWSHFIPNFWKWPIKAWNIQIYTYQAQNIRLKRWPQKDQDITLCSNMTEIEVEYVYSRDMIEVPYFSRNRKWPRKVEEISSVCLFLSKTGAVNFFPLSSFFTLRNFMADMIWKENFLMHQKNETYKKLLTPLFQKL